MRHAGLSLEYSVDTVGQGACSDRIPLAAAQRTCLGFPAGKLAHFRAALDSGELNVLLDTLPSPAGIKEAAPSSAVCPFMPRGRVQPGVASGLPWRAKRGEFASAPRDVHPVPCP